MQNADDAGATEVKFRLDRRQHSTNDLLAPGLAQFQGPALYAWNNACFEEDDWEHIGKMYDSGKEKEPLKVGRFGLGFLSVFHMTGNDIPLPALIQSQSFNEGTGVNKALNYCKQNQWLL